MSTARLTVTERSGRLHVRWSCPDVATWQACLLDFKAAFPTHAERIYLPGERAWSLPLRCRRRLQDWSDAWFDSDAQHWDDDEPEEEEPAHRGRPREGVPQTIAQAYAELYLLPDCPLWAVEAMYKAASKRCHPDAGGDEQAMARINEAVAVIRRAQQGRRSA